MITIEKTDAEIAREAVDLLNLTGKVWCFMAGMHPHPRMNTYLLGVATLGEAGWSPLPLHQFESYGDASDRADELNKVFGYNPDTCVAIVADTMSRSKFKAEQESLTDLDRVYKMKITFRSDTKARLYEDDIIDEIKQQIEEIGDAYGVDEVEIDLK